MFGRRRRESAMTTTDPAAVEPAEILPTCPDCGSTYGPLGHRPDRKVFAAWLAAHERPHDPAVTP